MKHDNKKNSMFKKSKGKNNKYKESNKVDIKKYSKK